MVSAQRHTHIMMKGFAVEDHSEESGRVTHSTLRNPIYTLSPFYGIYSLHILLVRRHRIRAAAVRTTLTLSDITCMPHCETSLDVFETHID